MLILGITQKGGGGYVNTARILKAPGHATPPLENHGQTKSCLIKDKSIIILLKNFLYLDSVSIDI